VGDFGGDGRESKDTRANGKQRRAETLSLLGGISDGHDCFRVIRPEVSLHLGNGKRQTSKFALRALVAMDRPFQTHHLTCENRMFVG